ncbi:hypothetical protein KY290_016579 [Solanum tuberosum]|uniref:Uncharacterized protein n=1 Tax=Solanum tuberosum TaxID=4113 RepID=A0ABQ7VAR2_SOLTU|nr:hypothetical protein KY284_015856 [Solanum tuberosum]KAH0760506.1 hypothetical protein KY290_016579 [Solanum tuberosum]
MATDITLEQEDDENITKGEIITFFRAVNCNEELEQRNVTSTTKLVHESTNQKLGQNLELD